MSDENREKEINDMIDKICDLMNSFHLSTSDGIGLLLSILGQLCYQQKYPSLCRLLIVDVFIKMDLEKKRGI